MTTCHYVCVQAVTPAVQLHTLLEACGALKILMREHTIETLLELDIVRDTSYATDYVPYSER